MKQLYSTMMNENAFYDATGYTMMNDEMMTISNEETTTVQ